METPSVDPAASELARKRWARIPLEERSRIMKQVRAGTSLRKRLKKKNK